MHPIQKGLLFSSVGMLAAMAPGAHNDAAALPASAGGASHDYSCSELSSVIVRSNAGAPMNDTMLGAGSACLAAGKTITIRNADRSAWLSVYGRYNAASGLYTWMEGGITAGGAAPVLSIAFIRPGETRTFVYDPTVVRFPNGTNTQGGQPIYNLTGALWRIEHRENPSLWIGEPQLPPGASGNLPVGNAATAEAGGSGSAGLALRLVRTPEPRGANWETFLDDTLEPASGAVNLWGHVWSVHNAGRSWSMNVASGPGRPQIVRLELRAGDHWNGDVKAGCWSCERSMMQMTPRLTEGTTYWEAYSFMIEPGATEGALAIARGSYWLVLENVHSYIPATHGKVVPIQTELLPGDHLAVRADPGNDTLKYLWIDPVPLKRGVWHDVVREFNVDPTGQSPNSGIREWLDGRNVVDYGGPMGEANDQPYFVFEPYRNNFFGPAITITEDIANFEEGTTSLMARVKRPGGGR